MVNIIVEIKANTLVSHYNFHFVALPVFLVWQFPIRSQLLNFNVGGMPNSFYSRVVPVSPTPLHGNFMWWCFKCRARWF